MVNADELIASMDESGVDASVTFGFPWVDQQLNRETNDYVVEAVSRWPDRIFGFAQLNPAATGALPELERCMQKGLSGLGELMPHGQGYRWDDPRLHDLLQQMAHWQRPVLIHCGEPVGHSYPGKSQCTLQPLYQLALRNPQLTLVAAHWGGGLFFYELMPEVRETLRNVYYDTAASPLLYQDDIFPLAERIIPQKMLFATDYPLISQGPFLRRVRRSGLSADGLDSILHGNAARLLQIQGAPNHGTDSSLCGHRT